MSANSNGARSEGKSDMDQKNDGEKGDGTESETNEEKYKVPAVVEAEFTSQEVESTIALFQEIDEDGSGSIDVDELGLLFDKMEEEVTHEELRGYVKKVDEDESGELEFGEL